MGQHKNERKKSNYTLQAAVLNIPYTFHPDCAAISRQKEHTKRQQKTNDTTKLAVPLKTGMKQYHTLRHSIHTQHTQSILEWGGGIAFIQKKKYLWSHSNSVILSVTILSTVFFYFFLSSHHIIWRYHHP